MQQDDNAAPRFSGQFQIRPADVIDAGPPDHDRPTWLRLPMYRPMFTIGILVVLAGVFLLQQAIPNNEVEFRYLKNNEAIINGEWWRLLTATLLHANWPHILFNGMGIYLFGQQIETFYGRGRFLSIYVLSGLSGSIASFAFSPYDSLGASGALFGLVGAMGVYYWTYRDMLGSQGRAQLWNVLFIVGINLAFGFSQADQIDNWGHIGGLVAGTVAGIVLLPRYKPGRYLASDERMLEDSTPPWLSAVGSAAIFVVLAALFAVALLVQSGRA